MRGLAWLRPFVGWLASPLRSVDPAFDPRAGVREPDLRQAAEQVTLPPDRALLPYPLRPGRSMGGYPGRHATTPTPPLSGQLVPGQRARQPRAVGGVLHLSFAHGCQPRLDTPCDQCGWMISHFPPERRYTSVQFQRDGSACSADETSLNVRAAASPTT
jgi:hypothetical protein